MSHVSEVTVSTIDQTVAAQPVAIATVKAQDVIKDSGKVRVGQGMLRF